MRVTRRREPSQQHPCLQTAIHAVAVDAAPSESRSIAPASAARIGAGERLLPSP
jgi:hypothetical protein